MSEEKTETQTPEQTMVVPTNLILWDYLLKGAKRPPKFSRCEAFCDLIKRQQKNLLQTGEPYILGSASELSLAWHWDRETVSRFFDQLTKFGILLVHDEDRRTSYSLRCSLETLTPQCELNPLSLCPPSPGRPSGT